MELLRRVPEFRRLFVARAVSEAGSWLAYVALSIEVYRLTGSAAWIAALLVVEFAPTPVVALTLAPLVDRLPRKLVLVGADATNAAVFAALAFVRSPAAIVALAAVAGCALAFFRPAVRAAAPNVVDDEDLPRANSLLTLAETASLALGPLAGGLLAATSVTTALLLNAASFLASALLVARIPRARLQSEAASSHGHLRDLRDGLRAVAEIPLVRAALVGWSLATLAMGATNGTELVLAKTVFHAGDLGYGLMASLCGVGLVAGSALAPRLLERAAPLAVFGGGLGLMAAATVAVAVAPGFAVALACVVAMLAGNGVAVVARALVVQRAVPDELRGRVFMLSMGCSSTTNTAGTVIAGTAVALVGGRWVWAAAGLALAAAAASVLVRPRTASIEPAGAPA